MTRLSTTKREQLYVVGSVIWLANGTMATRILAKGDKDSCEAFAQTAEHPLEPGDSVHPSRPAKMLVKAEADWNAFIAECFTLDGRTEQ